MGLPVGAFVEGFAVVPGLTVGFLVVGVAVPGLTAAVGLIVGFGVFWIGLGVGCAREEEHPAVLRTSPRTASLQAPPKSL